MSEHTKAIAEKSQMHQIKDVLRAKVGDELLLWKSGEGCDFVFEISHITSSRIEGAISYQTENKREPLRKVTLYCALLKRENFELVLQKCTEVGVSAFVPLLTERTVKTGFNRSRFEQIIQEAAEQSGRGVMPELGDPVTFIDALAQGKGYEIFFCDARASHEGIRGWIQCGAATKQCADHGCLASIFIGPEGGWSDTEVEQAQKIDCMIASLGSLTLRAETAAIVASYEVLCNS